MILVFDLDDTLYDELSFVQSGFLKVAEYVNKTFGIDTESAYDIMHSELETNGRGKVFDTLLLKYKVYSKSAVGKCVSVYRLHTPEIELNPDAVRCLDRFKQFNKYIVTDGNKVVQRNKLNALGLPPVMKKIFITHEYGKKNAKPSAYCFNLIAKLEKTPPGNIVYIADNPQKDFINIKKLGFKTVRICQGMFANLKLGYEYEAHFTINCLDQLTLSLIEKFTLA
ncbi:HAD family hydrolase [uncultured Desulfobacter sp.]|uniref:HAD family hydrolase n=1 Tax=uncultured Desulfobacter sp. TaxID=240139 RepID=UPI002AAA76D3|nr:HAD family hydrolase [uncultured Desulfobacter sp.]